MIPTLPAEYTHPMGIGKGGFASVYRVKQAALDRWVAIKIIEEKSSKRRKELLQEGKTQANLQIRYVPQVYDAFEWKKKVYIVMQWIKGISLFDLIENSLSEENTLMLADAFIHALAELHASGYAHRDIKPHNIIISPKQGIYIVDFAFAKHRDDIMASMEGAVKGTPAYMAPELWRGDKKMDYIRADIYSAGVILSEMLKGKQWMGLLSKLVDINPENRPESACELLEQWKYLTNDTVQSTDWEKLTSEFLRKSITGELNKAAQDLMQVDRLDEAYWLLVESLEENPDDPETILLLQKVAQLPKKKTKAQTIIYSGIAAIILLSVFFAYYLGKQTGEAGSLTGGIKLSTRKIKNGLEKTLIEKRQLSFTIFPFLTDSLGREVLSGQLFIVDYPQKGSLIIDTREYSPKEITEGITLPSDKYTVMWKDESDVYIWRERVMILPFQKKVINLPVKYNY